METLYLTRRVDNALLASKKGVAGRTQFHSDLGLGGTGRPRVSTRTNNLGIVVIAGMNFRFHTSYLSIEIAN